MQSEWQKRAQVFGADARGVLFKNLPGILNDHIHMQHEAWISKGLADLGDGARVLDLGCGYGRLANSLSASRPDTKIIGCDLAFSYAVLFQSAGQNRFAVVGDAARLPFRTGVFAGAYAVTVQMYQDSKKAVTTRIELERVLMIGGACVLIEPETAWFWGRLLRIIGKSTSMKERLLDSSEISSFIRNSSFTLRSRQAMPVFSWMLPLLAVLDRWTPPLIHPLLRVCRTWDAASSRIRWGSLHTSYCLIRK